MPNEPRILDREGNEIRVGDRVHDRARFHGHPDHRAAVTEIKWTYGWEVWLRGPDDDPREAETFEAHVVADEEPNTYRCPDLLLNQPASTNPTATRGGSSSPRKE